MDLLLTEAVQSCYFNSVDVFTQPDLPPSNVEFAARAPRGYGYWTWKPLVMRQMMNRYPDGDILMYADAGCSICTDPAARKQFKQWILDVREHPTHRLAFQMNWPEETWTKGELFAFMDCDSDVYRTSGQHSASIQVYMNTPENRAFMDEYVRITTADNFHYVSDEPSRTANAPSFRDHRHDQSIVSLLFKKHGAKQYPDHWMTPGFPILTARRKFRFQE
jgi:hypothetical protein